MTRAAIVTGATRGIGRAMVDVLVTDGFSLTLVARGEPELADIATQLRSRGVEVSYVVADVGDSAAIRHVVDSHRDKYQRLDLLVNNAGVALHRAVDDLRVEEIDRQIAVNLRAPLLLARHCANLLRTAGRVSGNALVINTASVVGPLGQIDNAVYAATKAALISVTRTLNREWGFDGVKAMALCPGYVATALTEHVHGAVPAHEMMTPLDIAEGLRFALRLSRYCVVPDIVFERPGATAP